MAVPSNKSSSSPIASRANPNLRNSEVVNPMRRSFSGNPFAKPSIVANPRSFNPNTPANSPSEHPRRSSIGRETVVTFRDCEDKENSKDQNWKPMRVRSPIGAKGTKNFMSPTISAASKITAVSPRKKILVERNEAARTSVSLSDLKKVSFAPTVEDSEHKEVGLTTPLVSKALKTQVDLDSNEPLSSMNEPEEPVCVNASEEPDSVNLDPSFKISPPPPSCPEASGSVLAPLDADPSVPLPYDPKTNYLSPRPQFLHYKPNPRIEYYLSKDREGKRLEDSFTSGSFSDTDVTEETQSEYSQKELEDVTSGAVVEQDQQQEEKEVEEEVHVSGAVVEQDQQQEEKEVEEEVHVSEPSPISPINTLMSKEEAVEVKGSCKPSFFWRSKFTALVLVLAVAVLSVSVINSPLIDGSVLKDLSFVKEYDQSEVAEFARVSFDGLARNFRVWSDKSVSFISELISYLRGAHNLGPLHYCNLTVLTEDVRVDGYSVFDHSYKGTDGMYEFDVLGHTTESLVDIEATEEKGQPEIGATKDIVEARVDPEYEEQVNQEAEAPVDIESLEEKGQPEVEAAEKTVEVHVDPEYEEQIEQEAEAPVDNEPLEEKGQPEIEAAENIVEVHVDPEQSEQETTQAGEVLQAAQADVTEIKSTETEQGQEENVVSDHADSEPESNVSMKKETVMISQAAEGRSEVFEVEELQAESKMSTDTEVESVKQDHTFVSSEVDSSPENMQSLEAVDLTVDGAENKAFIYVALLVSALIGSTAFIYVKKGKSSTPNPAISVVQPLLTKKLDAIPNVPVSTEHTFQERPSSWNWVGEPCPSEMSSFRKSSSYAKKGLKQSDEAESQEKRPRKNHRRESLASIDSSMGSPSYGSFTTYERIPIKHGHGEEEVVTPVRRSSRIRKQANSP